MNDIDIEALGKLAATVTEERRRLAEHDFYDENSQRDSCVMSVVRFQQALVTAWPAMFDAIETGRQWETIARQQEAYAGHETNCDIWDVDARGFCSCGYDRAEAAFRDVADRTPTPTDGA